MSTRSPWRSLTRAFSWHRRKLAVLAAAAAVLTGLAATQPDPPPTLTVVRLSQPVPAGVTLGESDVELHDIRTADAPVGALTDLAEAIGHRLTAGAAEGQVLTDVALLDQRSATPGYVLAPLRLADADLATLLRPGQLVDVVAADAQSGLAEVVADRVRIVSVPVVAESASTVQSGALVIVETETKEATTMAKAAVSGTLTVIWR